MKTVYKYPLALGQNVIEVAPYTLAKVGLDPSGGICVWLLHGDNEAHKYPKTFFVIGTGHPVPSQAYLWLGTVIQGDFVWHIFTT